MVAGIQFSITGCGAAWLARLIWDQEVAGSNPVTPTIMKWLFTVIPYSAFFAICKVCGANMLQG